GLKESPGNVPEYRCEITGYYVHLRDVSEEFGNVLLSQDYDEILAASISAIASFDEMSRELGSMAVPAEMREAHDALVNAVGSYRQSADLIRIAIGTSLGKYEEKGDDLQGLIDQSVYLAAEANQYLERSLVLHGEVFQLYAEVPGENACGTYTSWDGYSVFPGVAGSDI
ncbi:MAG: hypothetical protein KC473_11190, partial [Candidatus Dadabacteria bacterium]|nr:hypothetical protein [Candidatus Dadabacteria bacterium]